MTLAFTEYGEGSPVVVLHGVFGSGRNWAGMAKQLAADHRIITVDMPNHGDSPWVNEVTYELMAIAGAYVDSDQPSFIHKSRMTWPK